ncbi:hypothetical protein LMG31886_01380 [Xanthomonas hydrangeae]|nr:hypothetical protein LMG31886_01380 [Xanthomonas hydrangeae]CAD7720431.1 hypothetical protein LMG31886_01380 [Xanthomonas hydrangeae]CAD7729870.1 hypothetical protein LMG31885_14110 [Xanthomonas hydrangeae]CAD7729874.1 hypothetical protein LMG31885_14110 [Xanthomonas hydrangeae]
MSAYFEIAYAAASGNLCLFTGTGFSKAITGNNAPTWQGLLEELCMMCPNSTALKESLFPPGKQPTVSLDEAAQIISIALSRAGKQIHAETAAIIERIVLSGDNSAVQAFLSDKSVKVITTNYDKLVEQLAGESSCQSIAPGLPIPRAQCRIKVYHVHGSVVSPENMIITSDDYFRFINAESYFSRKLSTILHENTVVILGYSLGDTNLKAILSDYKGFSKTHFIGSNIFFVSRTLVSQYLKDYYSHCYGIRVLDGVEVAAFFGAVNAEMPSATTKVAGSIENIRRVMWQGATFTDAYIRIENSFYEIIASLGAEGISISNPRVVKVLGDVIAKKVMLTRENSAWVQYEHLTRWITYLGSLLDIRGTPIEATVLDAALHSMNTMSRKLLFGYSWKAFEVWSQPWPALTASNRATIRHFIEAKTQGADALAVVQLA